MTVSLLGAQTRLCVLICGCAQKQKYTGGCRAAVSLYCCLGVVSFSHLSVLVTASSSGLPDRILGFGSIVIELLRKQIPKFCSLICQIWARDEA